MSKIVEVLRVLGASLLALFSFDYGTKRAENKQLKRKAKANAKHTKNRKLIANMSDEQLRKYLFK